MTATPYLGATGPGSRDGGPGWNEEEMKTELSRHGVHFSSKSQEWYTPPEIIERVVKLFGSIDLDPCSEMSEHPNVPAARYFTVKENGLEQVWDGKVYMNPPYGRGIGEWIEKLCTEYESGNVKEAVALLPVRPDTAWWRKLRDYAICFIKGRLKFSRQKYSAPFPSCVAYFGSNIKTFNNIFSDMGVVRIRWQGNMRSISDRRSVGNDRRSGFKAGTETFIW